MIDTGLTDNTHRHTHTDLVCEELIVAEVKLNDKALQTKTKQTEESDTKFKQQTTSGSGVQFTD